jgi:hypothetical protein
MGTGPGTQAHRARTLAAGPVAARRRAGAESSRSAEDRPRPGRRQRAVQALPPGRAAPAHRYPPPVQHPASGRTGVPRRCPTGASRSRSAGQHRNARTSSGNGDPTEPCHTPTGPPRQAAIYRMPMAWIPQHQSRPAHRPPRCGPARQTDKARGCTTASRTWRPARAGSLPRCAAFPASPTNGPASTFASLGAVKGVPSE